ncbi:ribosome-inactivating family protein [Kitasatospora sp. NPDC048545]|uniref:ribosome-inactivating family protein n=1 Tax=Kitasatospora sp. NPDC048545 TaxID=3157208 RepID=UPI0033C21739
MNATSWVRSFAAGLTVLSAVAGAGVAVAAPARPGPAALAQRPPVRADPSLNTSTATAANYSSFVQAVRLRATNGEVFYQSMYKVRPRATNDLFPVAFTTASGAQVWEIVRSSDLYGVGWYTPRDDTYHALKEHDGSHTTYKHTANTRQVRLDYDGSYTTLERRAQTSLEAVTLGRTGTDRAAAELATKSDSGKEAAAALLVLAQEVNEAARFIKIDDLVNKGWTSSIPTADRGLMVDLEKGWASFSAWAVNKLNNPATPPHRINAQITVNDLQTAQTYLRVVKVL